MKDATYHHRWGAKVPEEKELEDLYGELIQDIDESESYEIDQSKLFRKDGLYTILTAFGCSCWDGDWEGWTEVTVEELLPLAKSWGTDRGSQKSLGKWILENIKETP